MQDRSWMIEVKAVRAAKQCIELVREELGVKLLLSNPDFLDLLKDYTELTDSIELQAAYADLMVYADKNTSAAKLNATDNTVVSIRKEDALALQVPVLKRPISEEETIKCGGKLYLRWRDGKEFSGLYRGQPMYR